MSPWMKMGGLSARLRDCVRAAALGLLLVSASAVAQTTVEYIHTDALGSPVAVTNASGQVVERSFYEPYGAQVDGAPDDGPGFTGHVEDAATGLIYMQQRYYDPMIGRFLSVDPVGVDSGTSANFSRYWYANNNPYKFFDPDGRLGCTGTHIQSVCDGGGVAGLRTSVRSPLDIGPDEQSSRDASQTAKSSRSAKSSRTQQAGEIAVGALVALMLEIPEMFPDGGRSDLSLMASIFVLKNEGAEIGPLIGAANKPFNASGLSVAARAWEKHAGRPGGSFSALKGGIEQKNLAAENFVRSALSGKRVELSRGGFEYRISTGQGVRYNQDGSFSGFLDPSR